MEFGSVIKERYVLVSGVEGRFSNVLEASPALGSYYMAFIWAFLICHLHPCYSKLEHLLEMQNTGSYPELLNQKLHFNNIPG